MAYKFEKEENVRNPKIKILTANIVFLLVYSFPMEITLTKRVKSKS